MAAVIEAESILTERYQTTVPEAIRHVLQLHEHDRLHYALRPNGEVVITRAPTIDVEESALETKFLDFLAHDIETHPERLRPFDPALLQRALDLVGDIEVDLDAPLPIH